MKQPAVEINALSKEYRIQRGQKHRALEDVSFQLEAGQALGLIGHNGSGKSTLLKILSRITYPTGGQVKLNGTLSSLLEVGTGFHPELTGRENIYLNGSILGMRRSAIRRRFDEIVDFAGVEKFLDMPVKRYSSGMFVRLAFSVAAHLDADILLIDEVLAVGDAQFQKKCLNHMNQVSQEQQRSIIFVSHNMSAITSLCDRAALLEQGRLIQLGPPTDVVHHYLDSLHNLQRDLDLEKRDDRIGEGPARLRHLEISAQEPSKPLMSQKDARLNLRISAPGLQGRRLRVELELFNTRGNYLSSLVHEESLPKSTLDSIDWCCHLPELNLMPGDFFLNSHLFLDGRRVDFVGRAHFFTVIEEEMSMELMPDRHKNPGVYLEQRWE